MPTDQRFYSLLPQNARHFPVFERPIPPADRGQFWRCGEHPPETLHGQRIGEPKPYVGLSSPNLAVLAAIVARPRGTSLALPARFPPPRPVPGVRAGPFPPTPNETPAGER